MSRGGLFVVVIAVLVVSGCSEFTQARPTDGEPRFAPPEGYDQLVAIDGDEVTDSDDIVGSCVWTYLWSETERGDDWSLYALGRTLITPDGQDERGRNLFCDLAGHPGPRTYLIPLEKLEPGWYSACTSGCTEPFRVP